MTHSKLLIALFASLLLFAGCGGPTFTQPTRPDVKNSLTVAENYSRPLQVGSQTILVEVADTDASRSQGLSGRAELIGGRGMLFDFTNTNITRPGFWMKDMNFDLDLVWINNGKVIGITPNVPAPTDSASLPTYSPPADITQVLEVPSGWCERVNVKIGDEVKI